MRRVSIKLISFFLLGAIVNVAVAWGCVVATWPNADLIATYKEAEAASWPRRHTSDNERQYLRGCGWHLWQMKHAWHGHVVVFEANAIGVRSLLFHEDSSDRDEPFHIGRKTIAGWPLSALSSYHQTTTTERNVSPGWHLVGGNSAPAPPVTWEVYQGVVVSTDIWTIQGSDIRLLPSHTIWPGFAINTIFYAAVLWLLFAAPGFVRRRLRHVRGRCIHCGYDLRGQRSDSCGELRCPECGKSVHGAAAPATCRSD